MADTNIIVLHGRVGKDPEVRRSAQGTAVVNFSIASTSWSKDKAGKWKDKSSWFDIVMFKEAAERFAERARKGDAVTVTGSLQQRTWKDKDDNKREKVEVIARNIQYHQKKRPNEDERNYGEAAMEEEAAKRNDEADF